MWPLLHTSVTSSSKQDKTSVSVQTLSEQYAFASSYHSYRNALETGKKVQENIIEILKEMEWSQQCNHSNSISPWTMGSGGKHEERWIKIEKLKSFVLHDTVFLEASVCVLGGRMVNALTLYFKAVKHSPQFTPHFISNLPKSLLK